MQEDDQVIELFGLNRDEIPSCQVNVVHPWLNLNFNDKLTLMDRYKEMKKR